MRILFLLLVLLLAFSAESQKKILFIGNYQSICFSMDSLEIEKKGELPSDLTIYQSIFLFSSAESALTSIDVIRLENYLFDGGNIYCGAENWPLQAESNQLTSLLFGKICWGNFEEKQTNIEASASTNHLFVTQDTFPTGKTTVAFPLDYRLKVEVWVNDHPLILSGNYGNGNIILDGGYSRFYCETMDATRNEILKMIVQFFDR